MEEQEPALAAVPAEAAPSGDVDLPEIELLRFASLWARVLTLPEGGREPEFPEDAAQALLAEGAAAIPAMIELCYPPEDFDSVEELAAAVRALGEPETREAAIPRLAFTLYRHRDLRRALAGAGPEARRTGEAILRWRERTDPFHEAWRGRFLGSVVGCLVRRLPLPVVREAALANLPRLAAITRHADTFVYYEPLGPLLSSIRMSPDPAERDRLGELLLTASPQACVTALHAMVYELTRGGEDWRPLPAHRYPEEAWRAGVLKAAPSLLSDNHYEEQAVSFALYWMKNQGLFDAPALLSGHEDERIRAKAAELARRR
jgi:hypothetical protein